MTDNTQLLSLAGKSFALVENDEGHASASTLMVFDARTDVCTATYTGPNVKFGHVVVSENQMLYHAYNEDGSLSAGVATIRLKMDASEKISEMMLQWKWLTGDLSSGVSHWRCV